VPLGTFLTGSNREEGSIRQKLGYFMIICDEIELTKNEILGTIDTLVVCFDIETPVGIRLIHMTVSAESPELNNTYGK
jgi:hypothetical protein